MITSFKTEGLGFGFDFDITLEPDKKIYCFIGKNGIGKTQLLENMAKSLIFQHSIFRKQSAQQKLRYEYRFFKKDFHDKFKEEMLELPESVDINGIRLKDKTKDKWRFTRFETVAAKEIQTVRFICDQPIVFIGAKNRGFTKNVDTNNIKILSSALNQFIESFERTWCYLNGEGLEQQEIADWFTSRLIINPNFVIQNQNREHEAITVLEMIDRLDPSLNLVTDNQNGSKSLKLAFHEGQLRINNIPLDKLSTGYVSIIKIFQEIVAGYGGWTNEPKLNEVEGIVFIDELEPHLHIGWQTKIINLLRQFFPNTTFFISTHSPLVLAGLKNGEGYELIRDGEFVKTKTIENIESYVLNDIVTRFFGVDLNKQRIENTDKMQSQKIKASLLELAKALTEDTQ
jgi:predicted ATP-binding protein involved in virulence